MRTNVRRAFSLVELMTVIGIIALLISLLLPALSRARETGRRTVCMANLRSIAQGCIAYSVNNEQHVPSWGQRIAGFAAMGQAWDWDGVIGSPSDPGGDIRSNTRNVWMLVRGQAGDPKTFICPSDNEAGEAFQPGDIKYVYDVQNRSQFSYSFQYQGPRQEIGQTTLDAVSAREGWNTTMRDDPKLVIAADATPCMTAVNRSVTDTGVSGTSHLFRFLITNDVNLKVFVNAMVAMASTTAPIPVTYNVAAGTVDLRFPSQQTQQAMNSANHRNEGQNVVRLEGSGEFAAHPCVGAFRDNIYTVQDPTVYEEPLNLEPGATQVVKNAVARARTVGLYETYTDSGLGTETFAYTEAGIMQAWVRQTPSKTRFADSFLVP